MLIIIINLNRNKERKEFMINQFKKYPEVKYIFFDAVDGLKLSDEELQKNYDEKKSMHLIRRRLKNTEIACSLSHKAVYEYIVQKAIKWACVLEDDIVFSDDLFSVLDCIENSMYQNTVIKLDQPPGYLSVKKHTKTLYDNYFLTHPYWNSVSTMGYCIDNKAASKLLRLNKKIFTVADHWDLYQQVINIRALCPEIVRESTEFQSDIGNRVYIDTEKKQPKIIRKIVKRIRYLLALINYDIK